jgi:hypothetical protein
MNMHWTDERRKMLIQQEHEIQQILGKALGYPWYKDDQKNFPEATEEDGVCVGDHFSLSLVDEAADRIRKLERERDEARYLLIHLATCLELERSSTRNHLLAYLRNLGLSPYDHREAVQKLGDKVIKNGELNFAEETQ